MKALLTLLLLFSVTACQLTQAESVRYGLLNQSFELQSVDGKLLSDILGDQYQEKQKPSIEFQQSFLLAGRTGCNRFFGQGELASGVLTLKPGGQTRMMCPPPYMKLENTIMTTLHQGASLELHGDLLTLKGTHATLVYLKSYQ